MSATLKASASKPVKVRYAGKEISIQAEAAFVNLLQALPSALPNGTITGLRARAGIGVDLTWRNGKLVRATLKASASKPVKVRYAGKEISIQAKAGQSYIFGPELSPSN